MKKIFGLIIILLLLASLCACSINITVPTGADDEGYWGRITRLNDNNTVNSNAEITKVTVTETELDTVIYDWNLISITATNLCYDETYGPAISFEIDNLSENNITVEASVVIVNGRIVPVTFSAEAPALEIMESVLYLPENELKNLNISEIGKIEVKLKITDNETGEYSDTSDTVRIYYNDEIHYSKISYCTEMLSLDGITLYIGDTNIKDNDSCDYVAEVFVLNENAEAVSIKFEDISINDKEIDIECTIYVPSNSSVYQDLYFDKSTLKKNSIDTIETIMMRFEAYYTDTKEIIFDTGFDLFEIEK